MVAKLIVLPTPRCSGVTSAIGTSKIWPAVRRWNVRASAVGNFGGHADGFAQGRVRVNGLADVDRVAAHLDGQTDFADHVASIRADDGTADDAMRFGIEDQLGKAVV